MMRYPNFYITCLFLCIGLSSYGQVDFRPGYIIKLDLDTVYGQIDYRGDLRLSRTCVFKEYPKSDPATYGPGEITAFRFEQGRFYISKNIPSGEGEEMKFLEFLVNGMANLYYYRDEMGDHYFIEREEGELLELTNETEEVYINGVSYSKESNRHIGLLKATLSDSKEIQSDIEKASLTHKSLINIASTYHDYVCDGEKCIIYEKEIPVIRVHVAPLLGVGINRVSFKLNELLENLVFESSLSPEIGAQISILAPRLNEKISVQLEAILSKNYHYGFFEDQVSVQTDYYDAHLNTLFLGSSLGFKYTYPKGKVRPTLALGGLLNARVWSKTGYTRESVYGQVVTTDNYSDLPITRLLWGGMAEVGLNYHLGQHLLLFSHLRIQTSWGIDNQVSTEMQSVSMAIGIHF